MRLEDLLSELLLAFVDISIELVAVLSDGELLIVVNRDVDLLAAHWLVLRVVELGHIRVSQGLLCCQTLVRVKLKKALQKVQGIIRGCRENISQALGLSWRQRF